VSSVFKFLVIIFLGITSSAAQQKTDDIEKNIFLGQAFASQNVYFIGFAEQVKWSDNLEFHGLNSSTKTLSSKKEAVIPACSEKSYFFAEEKNKAKVDYFSGAFFSTILDDCVEEIVGVYRSNQKIQSAYNVFAWNPKWEVKNISFKNKDQLRPVAENEIKQMQTEKMQAEKNDTEFECTTEPQFIDNAKIFLEFDFGADGLQGRLSGYFNLGCAGHLADIYILDIFQGKNLIKSVQTYHYQGAI